MLELAAAVSGTFYIRNTKNLIYKPFVFYLWLTFFTEFIAEYTHLMQDNYDNSLFIYFKNSVFCRNHWLYNIYSYLAIGIIGIFYSGIITNKTSLVLIRSIIITYSIFVFCFYTFTDAFFVMGLPYDSILATIIICIYVLLYFIALIKSDSLLEFYKMPSFYITIGLLSWHICFMPLEIYNEHYRAINTHFIKFRKLLLITINIFTYSCFIFGFLYSLCKSKR